MTKESKKVSNIFNEIDDAIKKTKSPIPVTIADSKFYKLYLKIKDKYLEINHDILPYPK